MVKKKVMTKKKTEVKKLTRKKKSIETLYGQMLKSNISYIDSKEDYFVNLESCKSDHPNHCINSFLLENSEADLKDTVMVQVEMVGSPMVKTPREITIKKSVHDDKG